MNKMTKAEITLRNKFIALGPVEGYEDGDDLQRELVSVGITDADFDTGIGGGACITGSILCRADGSGIIADRGDGRSISAITPLLQGAIILGA